MKKTLLAAGVMALAMSANATDRYVSAAAAEGGVGTKAAPFKNLSEAIAVLEDGDVVYVTEGRYVPALGDAPRKASFKITGEKKVVIIGGYNSDFTEVIGRSLLSADVNGDDIYDENGILIGNFEDNTTRVSTISSSSNVTFKNCIFQGGYADDTENKLDTGGAMYIGSTCSFDNCILTGNYCKNSAGGGAICVKGNLNMNNCLVYGNQGSGDGGALYIKGDIYVSVTNCTFEKNKSTSGSAVFFNNALGCYFANNTFRDNASQTYGTFTVYNKNYANALITLVNNTFVNNVVTGNTTGKTNVGGAGVYVYTAATSGLNLINNTIIGNFVTGETADGGIADYMGGAVFARQGTLHMANNIIAGNVSRSGYGDLFKVDAAKITTKEYNFFTSYDNMNVNPDRNDIVAGIERAEGMEKLPTVFKCAWDNSQITAHCVYNGGITHTVEAHGENVDFDGLTINSIPASNLLESTLGVDVDNDGNKDGKLLYDQRGATRNQSGAAFIGAYENDGVTTGIGNVNADNESNIYVSNGKVVLPEGNYCYVIYTLSGQTAANGVANGTIELDGLAPGYYVVLVNGGTISKAIKVVL